MPSYFTRFSHIHVDQLANAHHTSQPAIITHFDSPFFYSNSLRLLVLLLANVAQVSVAIAKLCAACSFKYTDERKLNNK